MGLFQTDFSIDELKQRRRKVCDQSGPSAIALIQGADAPLGLSSFRQYNDFYYLCGVEVPHSYLLIDGRSRKTSLFLPRTALVDRDHDERPLTADDPDFAKVTTGVDGVQGIEGLFRYVSGAGTVYTCLGEGEGVCATPDSHAGWYRKVVADPWDGRPRRGDHFAQLLRTRAAQIEIRDLVPLLAAMRLVKSPREIELLRRAGQICARGLCDAAAATRPGIMEYQLEAVLRYHYHAGGAQGISYHAIVAGGANAFHAHYCLNRGRLADGDLVLLDCAPDYRYYTSDITRMWPVNGTYSPTQRALYGFVTEYHKTLCRGIRPGRSLREIEIEAAEIMSGRIREFAFASPAHEAGARGMFEFKGHLSHSVGMCVHDGSGHYERPLEPGMVFSVDPQMRIPEDRLYLRVEDTGVVTEDGFEIFTVAAPLELEAIEALMRSDGMLQRFPPVAVGPFIA